ncbi:uncharacterized protein LOC126366461 [Pectinophora gossypiella]|uniref:uncharacterized protein LOC126366461 n=1 Tax=Pectinophora gossypiella TaxID=13191 RepID=UPI00214E2E0E|nr:uncharacterized protein LOC126366461 [Pectinophora gossypiella]
MDLKASISIFLVLCMAWGAHGEVNCTATGIGRFADTSDTTCQNYTLCVLDTTTNTYSSYNYTCPTTSVFNPNTAQCTAASNYNCSSSAVCTADGYVADPDVTDCSSYIECVEIDGTFTETTYTCPDSTYFNPDTTNCESDYECTTSTDFSCTTAGRFANSTDTTCQTYYLCVEATDGSYTQYNYTCPTTSVFNPTTKVCTTSYTCTTT